MVGSSPTWLIIIRGNSASGKTSAAREIRRRFGRGVAIVSQDVIRRDILHQRDDPGNLAIGLIDLTARYALDHGLHVVVEGILYSHSYAEMLTNLMRDHQGQTAAFYYDLPFADTLARHETKPEAAEYGVELMADWYIENDLIPALQETVFGPDISLDTAVGAMMSATNMVLRSEGE